MADRIFPILGTTIAPMFGRTSTMVRIQGSLTKKTPDHLQIVGPRFAGKTVLLHELARRMRDSSSPYSAVLLWDLGHQTPQSDEAFMKGLCAQLASALAEKHPDYAAHLGSVRDNEYQEISEALELLKDDGIRVLIILDGFDKPLSSGKLTRNLWDQLRALGQNPSFRLITATRRTLRELIRSPDAQTSDFWNIFEQSPVRVGCFDERDFDEVINRLVGCELSAGAKTELWNASNGYPIVLLEVLNTLQNMGGKKIDSSDVVNASDAAFQVLHTTIESMWRDCPTSAKELMRRVLDNGPINRGGVALDDVNDLVERGFVQLSANRLQRPNRLLSAYLRNLPADGSSLSRLFGSPDSYRQNMKAVLELRLAHAVDMDAALRRYLLRGIEDFPEHPEVFFANIRAIAEQVFELIWIAELGTKRIPSEWFDVWRHNEERGIDEWRTRFPQGGQRVHLLNLMTGAGRSDRCAKYVTKTTGVLMDAAYTLGDFGQHREGAEIDAGAGYAGLSLCIELAVAITRELPRA